MEIFRAPQARMSGIKAKEEWESLGLEKRSDLENLKRVFERMDIDAKGFVDKTDIEIIYRKIGYKCKAMTEYGISEAADVIWENDEEDEGHLDFQTFVRCYSRCRKDKREPRRLFNLIEFMICDKDGACSVSEDEVAEVLRLRYGSGVMRLVTDKVYQRGPDACKAISYAEFLDLLRFFESHAAATSAGAAGLGGLGPTGPAR